MKAGELAPDGTFTSPHTTSSHVIRQPFVKLALWQISKGFLRSAKLLRMTETSLTILPFMYVVRTTLEMFEPGPMTDVNKHAARRGRFDMCKFLLDLRAERNSSNFNDK